MFDGFLGGTFVYHKNIGHMDIYASLWGFNISGSKEEMTVQIFFDNQCCPFSTFI